MNHDQRAASLTTSTHAHQLTDPIYSADDQQPDEVDCMIHARRMTVPTRATLIIERHAGPLLGRPPYASHMGAPASRFMSPTSAIKHEGSLTCFQHLENIQHRPRRGDAILNAPSSIDCLSRKGGYYLTNRKVLEWEAGGGQGITN